jgi:CheY-like chemotaxis protein
VGLALSQRLTEAMGGILTLEAETVGGAAFVVDLPAATTVPSADLLRESSLSTRSRATVLYIEDNLSNLRLVERVVARRGAWRLVHALHGGLGLDIARTQLPDLLLLDLHLPDLPGDQVLAALKAEPRTSGIPVYVISADATPGQRRRLLQEGATGYLTKPIDIRQLLEVLDTHVGELDGAAEPDEQCPRGVLTSRCRGVVFDGFTVFSCSTAGRRSARSSRIFSPRPAVGSAVRSRCAVSRASARRLCSSTLPARRPTCWFCVSPARPRPQPPRSRA